MRKTKKKLRPEAQVYDNTLKALFGDEAAEIISNLLPGVELVGEQNIEVDRSKLKADLVYNVMWNGKPAILNIELQTSSDKEMGLRFLQYYCSLKAKYKMPVITIVLYPFETDVPEMPYVCWSDEQVYATFTYRVFRAWEEDARTYVRKGAVVMYTFLPAMQHASVHLLTQALAQMQQRYPNRRVFEHHLIRFVKVLERSTTMSEQEKKKVKEVLHVQYAYDYFIDENPDVKERVTKGEQRGEQKGRLAGLQEAVVNVVKFRFPALAALAQQQIGQFSSADELNTLMQQLLAAPDEATALKLLRLPTA